MERLNIWGGLIREYKAKNIPLFLVPNKADLENKPLDLKKICEKYEMIKMKDISCKDPEKIDELKKVLNSIIMESYKRKKNRGNNLVYKKKGFCY
jgi:tRNA U34 5-carboxymethylaminomethyl modifying GTPase MnmE/TrmE